VIPQFPTKKHLELSDKEEIEHITKQFLPYSDFTFISLWSYDTQENREISMLHNNLVVLSTDYLTTEKLYSFIGTNLVSQTIQTLLQDAKVHDYIPRLEMIPEVCVEKEREVLEQTFSISDDRDNFDYVLSLSEILSDSNTHHYGKKKHYRNFLEAYPHISVKESDRSDPLVQEQVLQVFENWRVQKGASEVDSANERTAITRTLKTKELSAILLCLFDREKMIAFGIGSVCGQEYGEYHFLKVDPAYKDIYTAMYIEMARLLAQKGCQYLNIEQDLGIPGLRTSKEQWEPTKYLKKYLIAEKA